MITSGKFKSSIYVVWKDNKGIHKGLFANKQQAKNWCKRKKIGKCNRIK